MIRYVVIGSLAVTAGTAISAAALLGTRPDLPTTPVLVELFTSEGCSSCPSADALLRQLHASQPVDGVEVIVLSEHVDYWNRLGWTDPFSSAAFTERQGEYVTRLRAENLYTPQAVVDGAQEVIGNDRPALTAALRRAASRPKAVLDVQVTAHGPSSLRVAVSGTAGGADAKTDVMLALAEDDLTVQVGGGENAHKRLQHSGVVRRLVRAESVGADGVVSLKDAVLDLDPSWKRGALRVVAFAQRPGPGPVSAIGVTRVPS